MAIQFKFTIAKRNIFTPITFITCVLLNTPVHSTPIQSSTPSFNCGIASAVDEKIICGSSELSILDYRLAKYYRDALVNQQIDTHALQSKQSQWLKRRATCEYSFDCIKAAYSKRLTEIGKLDSKGDSYSWGGNYRQAPHLDAIRLGSTKERQTIKIISQTNIIFNGYPWFKIEVTGQEGYQWGDILCSPSYPDSTYCE